MDDESGESMEPTEDAVRRHDGGGMAMCVTRV